MMSRRARPSARTTRTAPTAPCVPVTRDGARVPRSVPRAAGPVTGNGSCTSVEGGPERSTGSPGGPRGTPQDRRTTRWTTRPRDLARGGDRRRDPARPRGHGGLQRHLRRSLLRPLRLAGGRIPRGSRGDPLPGRGGRRAARECALPGRPADRHHRRFAERPPAVPPAAGARAAAVRRHLGTGGQRPGDLHRPRRRSTSRSAGGRSAGCRSASSSASPPRSSSPSARSSGSPPRSRTTWYQAHIVAVGLTFLSIGIVLGADPEAAEDEPDGADDDRRR